MNCTYCGVVAPAASSLHSWCLRIRGWRPDDPKTGGYFVHPWWAARVDPALGRVINTKMGGGGEVLESVFVPAA